MTDPVDAASATPDSLPCSCARTAGGLRRLGLIGRLAAWPGELAGMGKPGPDQRRDAAGRLDPGGTAQAQPGAVRGRGTGVPAAGSGDPPASASDQGSAGRGRRAVVGRRINREGRELGAGERSGEVADQVLAGPGATPRQGADGPDTDMRGLIAEVGREVCEVGGEAARRDADLRRELVKVTTGSTVRELWAVILIGLGSVLSLWA